MTKHEFIRTVEFADLFCSRPQGNDRVEGFLISKENPLATRARCRVMVNFVILA